MTDDDHIRYMLDGGTRGLVRQLMQTKDAWGFGGTLWVAKEQPFFKDGPPTDASGHIQALPPRSRFSLQRFSLPETKAEGFAIWFQKGPPDTSKPLSNRSLCGWVRLEQEEEARAWLEFLNEHIQERLREAGALTPKTDAELEAESNARLQGTIAMLEGLGLAVPKAATMDEFVMKVKELAEADGPIDLRSNRQK